jgi:hypothetical protein
MIHRLMAAPPTSLTAARTTPEALLQPPHPQAWLTSPAAAQPHASPPKTSPDTPTARPLYPLRHRPGPLHTSLHQPVPRQGHHLATATSSQTTSCSSARPQTAHSRRRTSGWPSVTGGMRTSSRPGERPAPWPRTGWHNAAQSSRWLECDCVLSSWSVIVCCPAGV